MKASVVVGGADVQRTLDTWLAANAASAAGGSSSKAAFSALDLPPEVPLTRLGAGCVCCLGQVPLRVGLTRMVRSVRPDAVLLVLTHGEHLARVRALLADGSLGVRFELE